MRFSGLMMLLMLALPGEAQENAELEKAKKLLATQPARAAAIAKEVYDLSIDRADHYHAAASLAVMAASYRKDGDIQALFTCDSLGVRYALLSGDTSLILDALGDYAQDLSNNNYLEQAYPVLMKAESFLRNGYRHKLVRWLQLKAGCLAKMSKADEAIDHYRKAMHIAQEYNDADIVMTCKMTIAEVMLYNKGSRDSLHLIYEALDYFEKHQNFSEASKASLVIAFAFQTSFNPDKALSYYQQAAGYARQANDKWTVMQANQQIADLYITKKKYPEAEALLTQCEAFYETNYGLSGLAITKLFLGRLRLETGEFESAENYFAGAEAINKTARIDRIKMAIAGYRLMLALKRKDLKKTDSLSSIALSIAVRTTDKDLMNMAVKKVKEANENETPLADSSFAPLFGAADPKGKLTLSDSEMQRLANMNLYTGKDTGEDSTVLAAANRQVHDLEIQYRTRQIKDSLQNQRQENIIARQNIEKRNYLLIGSAILVLLLAAFGWLQFQNRKRAERDKQHIQLLQNEIHHRVKNNLAVINRLVEVAGKTAADTLPLSALKNRVKSIELLHKHLYSQEAKPGSILLQSYLEDLCTSIAGTFESSQKINIEVQAPVDVAAEIAEKLGLIINEFVTNSYKYAFAGRASGHIQVKAARLAADSLQLDLRDDGVGFDNNVKKDSYGMKLVKGLSHQLDGKFFFENNGGTHFQLVIPA